MRIPRTLRPLSDLSGPETARYPETPQPTIAMHFGKLLRAAPERRPRHIDDLPYKVVEVCRDATAAGHVNTLHPPTARAGRRRCFRIRSKGRFSIPEQMVSHEEC